VPSPLDSFLALRPRLFGLLYRITSSATESEDLLQDTWLRWQSADHASIIDPTAFLITTATRLALNHLSSAHHRRHTYIGPWLPEPVDTSHDPYLGAANTSALSFGILLLLDSLSPTERAAFVLREAFDFPYRDIATILDTTEANSRQLVTRARQHLASHTTTTPGPAHRQLLEAFLTAAHSGDTTNLTSLFRADITATSDGGGRVRASGTPLHGARYVANFVSSVSRRFWQDATLEFRELNGMPALYVERAAEGPLAVCFEFSGDQISHLYIVLNPEKLSQLAQPPGPR
jgi:RNA polymerase sigma-70 factor, ECF subfamily